MSVQKIEEDGKTFYRARWRDWQGKSRQGDYKLKREAVAREQREREAARKGYASESGRGRRKLSAFVQDWIDEPAKENTTAQRKYLKNNLGPLGKMPLGELTRGAIQSWINELDKGRSWIPEDDGLAPNTVKNLGRSLAAVLHIAEADGILQKTPYVKISVPKVSDRVSADDIPSPYEVGALIKRAKAEYGASLSAMIEVSALSGLRVSEVAGLQVRDVDEAGRSLVVRAQISRRGEQTDTKTESSQRKVPVGDRVLNAVRPFVEESADGYLFHRDGPRARSKRGEVWTAPAVGQVMPQLCQKAGVGPYSFHGFRHFFATEAMSRGVDLKTVQEALGHDDASTTMNIYWHVLPRNLDRLRSVVNGITWD